MVISRAISMIFIFNGTVTSIPECDRITRRSDKPFVDCVYQTVIVHDPKTGGIHQAQVFVDVPGISNYTFAKMSRDQTLQNVCIPANMTTKSGNGCTLNNALSASLRRTGKSGSYLLTSTDRIGATRWRFSSSLEWIIEGIPLCKADSAMDWLGSWQRLSVRLAGYGQLISAFRGSSSAGKM